MTTDSALPLVPELRFPTFGEHAPWVAKRLHELCDRVTETVGDTLLIPVSISAGKGFVPQAEKFGRDISGSQYNKYIRLRRGEFAYNRGNSKKFPQGCVYQLTEFDEAAASNAFYCFRLNDHVEPVFLLSFFEDNGHGRQLTRHITSGARSNGLLNISAEIFYGIKVPLPPTAAEQQKIAECIASLNDLIAAEDRQLEVLRRHKKELVRQLFPQDRETQPRMRFPMFTDAWSETNLLAQCSGILSGKDKLDPEGEFDLYGSTGLIGKTSRGSYEGKFLLIARVGANAGMLTVAAGQFGVTDNTLVVLLKDPHKIDFIFQYLKNIGLNKLVFGSGQPLITGGQLKALQLYIPSEEEQSKIADCISSFDEVLAAQSRKLEGLKALKQGLLQQLFPTPDGQ